MLRFANVKTSLSHHHVAIRKTQYADFKVSLMELRGDDAAYFTDDLEDALLTGMAMRRDQPLKPRA